MKKSNNILLGLMLTGAMLCSGDLSAQTEKVLKDSKKNLIENLDNIQLNHEQIVKSKISDLVAKFGLEKTKELVREHALIELNKYKKGEKYTTNSVLEKSAQNHADDMSKNNYFSHVNKNWVTPGDRVRKNGKYNHRFLGENISNGNNIYKIILSYVKSKQGGHEKILEGKYEDLGIGISFIKDGNPEFPKYFLVFDYGKTI